MDSLRMLAGTLLLIWSAAGFAAFINSRKTFDPREQFKQLLWGGPLVWILAAILIPVFRAFIWLERRMK